MHRKELLSKASFLRSAPPWIALCWGLALAPLALPLEAQERDAKPEAKPRKPPGEASGDTDPIHEEILKINYVFNRGLHELALPRYEQILAANGSYARTDLLHYPIALCHYNLATAAPPGTKKAVDSPGEASALRQGHLKKAVFHFKEAFRRKELEPRATATRLLGQSLLLLEDADAAAKAFQFVLDKMPNSPESPLARLGLAEARYSQGKFAEAAGAYRQFLEGGASGDDTDRAQFYLAMSLYKAGEAGDEASRAESIVAFEKLSASSSARHALDARYMLAIAREAKGELEAAAEAFRGIVEAGSKEYGERAQFGLAASLFRSGKHGEAQAALEQFLSSFPASERRDQATLLLARALLEQKQTTAAAKKLQELRNSPDVGDEASLHLARILTRHGKPRSAASVLAQALKDYPESRLREDLELDLISAQVADGNFPAALEEIRRVEATGKSGSTADQAAYLKAYALHRGQRLEESNTACAEFRRSFPQSLYLKDVLQIEAENKLLTGDAAGARATYEELLRGNAKSLTATQRLKARFRIAQAVYREKSYAEALKLFDAIGQEVQGPEETVALREDPLLRTLRYLIGECAYQEKMHVRAVSELRTFLTEAAGKGGLETETSDARFKLGHSLQLSGELKQAREAYLDALKVDDKSPHREQLLFELAQLAYSEKAIDEAARSFQTVIEEFPKSSFVPHSLKFLGWIAFDAKDAQKAVGFYKRLLREHPSHPASSDADYYLSLSLKALGLSREAREALENFRSKHPEDPRSGRSELEEAVELSKEKKHAEALAILERLRAQQPAPEMLTMVLYEVAWCHRGLGDLASARKAYQECLESAKEDGFRESTTLELGELEFDAGEYSRAQEILEPIANRNGPRREKALYRLTWTRQMLQDAEGVISLHESFVKAFPKSELSSELGVLAAKAHAARGDSSKAAQIFQSIADGRPDSPEAESALVSLGECLAEEKKFTEAQERFDSFLARYPKSPLGYRAHFGSAWALENLGGRDEAIAKYRAVVKETRTTLAARAQFQIGQCLVSKKDFKGAIVEFLQVPAAYSFPEWSSKALLQIAGCFEALDDVDNARKYYSEVKESYSARDEARLAQERLQKLEQ